MEITIIADDLTGANDSGVQLAKAGLDTVVWLDGGGDGSTSAEAVIVDTNSRALQPSEAKETIQKTMAKLNKLAPKMIFKKVDSTLRGNVGAELEAMIEECEPDYVFLAPTFLPNKRIVEQGILYVNGQPIGETEFAKNEADPVVHSAICDHVGKQFNGTMEVITEQIWDKNDADILKWLKEKQGTGPTVFVCDARSPQTLRRIATFSEAQQEQILLAGSAGLSEALTHSINGKSKQPLKSNHGADPILYLVGSMSEVSKYQVASLLQQEKAVGIRLDASKAVHEDPYIQALEYERIIQEAKKVLMNQQIPVVYSGTTRAEIDAVYTYAEQEQIPLHKLAKRIVNVLAVVGEALMDSFTFQAVIMTGGDTAKALCSRMKIDELRLLDEFEAGIPVAQFPGKYKNTYAITKAGAFGTKKTFSNLYDFFMEGATK
ncbi:four-carbon acid sugar kinase family protein [Shouchella patagoniensis]|uniref:four-carbon acid sugar kinase family protein n=1 Tax=Shouchella patagoniensis TaxID=228576 RepID=UPI000995B498|nr:four-carbon acid sugar kinase family protein [Shouchella patagoniensis]